MLTYPTSWLGNMGMWIGTAPSSEFDLARLAEEGLPTDIILKMTSQGLTSKEVFALVIPERTLKHRKTRKEPLSREESDRAIRAARVLAVAQATFGTQEKALIWMRHPKQRFHGRTPLDMLVSESGGRLVEEMLVQIDDGMFA